MAHKLDRFQTLRTLGIVAQSLKPVKLMSQQFPIATFFLFRDRRSVAQQCWFRWHKIVGATHAYYTWSLKSSRLYPFHDPLQEPTLLGVVTSVCIPLPTRAQQFPTLLAHNIIMLGVVTSVCLPLLAQQELTFGARFWHLHYTSFSLSRLFTVSYFSVGSSIEIERFASPAAILDAMRSVKSS